MTTRSFDPGSMPDQDRERVKITLNDDSRYDRQSPNAIFRFFALLRAGDDRSRFGAFLRLLQSHHLAELPLRTDIGQELESVTPVPAET